jgi:cytochrome c
MKLSMRTSFLVGVLVFSVIVIVAALQPASAQNGKGDPAKGKEIFMANCEICHNADSDEQKIGPGLKGLWNKPAHKMADGTEHKEHTDEIIRNQIVKGSSAMPPIGAALSEQELNDLMAYLHTL